MAPLRQIRKRDGRLVPFERGKIAEAIFRAAQAVGGEDRFLADQLAGVVEARVAARVKGVPTIEDVQDAVEKVLIEAGHARTAKTFILYRERRSEVRAGRGRVARRAQRERAPVEESSGPVPLVGGDPAPGQPAEPRLDLRLAGLPAEEIVLPPHQTDVADLDVAGREVIVPHQSQAFAQRIGVTCPPETSPSVD